MSNKEILFKFAVGTLNEYRSSVWVLKIHKNSAYLMSSDMGGTIKFTFHPDLWLHAYTEESKVSVEGRKGRAIDRWDKFTEISPGLFRAVSINVPGIVLQKTFKNVKNEKTLGVNWFLPPKEGFKQIFVLLLTKNQVKEDFIPSLALSEECIFSAKFTNGKGLFLVRTEVEMSNDEKENSLKQRGIAINYTKIPSQVAASLFIFSRDQLGLGYVMDVPLGWENVKKEK